MKMELTYIFNYKKASRTRPLLEKLLHCKGKMFADL